MIRGEVLGEGTFGKVYSAFSPHSNKEYAIKRNFVENTISFNNQVMEIDLLSRLRDHPFIVKIELVHLGSPFRNRQFSPIEINDIRKSQRDDGLHFVFNKAKHDLFSYIYNQTDNSFGLTKKYMVNMLLGTEYCHFQKIIHRDLKPSNILIARDIDGQYVPKITDFGLSKVVFSDASQFTSSFGGGTLEYSSPEQLYGQSIKPNTDLWAFGVISYEVMSGIKMFNAGNTNISPEAKRSIILKKIINGDKILPCY